MGQWKMMKSASDLFRLVAEFWRQRAMQMDIGAIMPEDQYLSEILKM